MIFVKLINSGAIEYASRVIFDDEKSYSNPTEETLRAHGYKPLVETECPSEEGYSYTYHFVDAGEQIEKVWDAVKIEEPVVLESEDELEG